MKSPKWVVLAYVILFMLFVGFQSNASDSTVEAIVWSAVVGVILAFGAWLNIRRFHRTDA